MLEREDAQLRAEADQIGDLLDEVRAMVAPPAWDKLEQVLHRVISLYSHGLARALAHAREAGADGSFDERLGGDDLLASLLLLHGLHPLAPEERIQRALEQLAQRLGTDAPAVTLEALDEDGAVRVHAAGPLGGGAMSARVVEATIRRAIEDVAPEVTRIELSGIEATPTAPELVQIRRSREVRR